MSKEFKNDSASMMKRLMRQKPKNKQEKKRPFDDILDPDEAERLDKTIDKIIDRAIEKANKKIAKRTNQKEFPKETLHKYVKHLFKENYKKAKEDKKKNEENSNKAKTEGQLTPLELANIALLGVLSAYVPGAQRIIVQEGSIIGNYYGAPDFNQYGQENYSFIAKDRRIDFIYGDSLGLETEAIYELLDRGDILDDLTVKFVNAGFLQQEERGKNKSTDSFSDPGRTPKLMPPVRHIVDEGEGE